MSEFYTALIFYINRFTGSIAFLLPSLIFAQPLVINNNGGATGIYIVMNGGTSTPPIYLVVNNSTPAPTDIKLINAPAPGTNAGWIISEGEYNRIVWNLKNSTGSFVFPLGKSTTGYAPFTFNITAAGDASGSIRLSSWATNAANAPLPSAVLNLKDIACADNSANVVDRFWLIDETYATTNPTATMTFTYLDGEVSANGEDALFAQRWGSATTICGQTPSWAPALTGQTASTAANTVTVPGVNDFSPWALVRSASPLPVELLSFSGACKNGNVVLQWETAAEVNNAYFTIEKSYDGNTFETLAVLQGSGTSNTIKSYSFTDDSPHSIQASSFFYRLRQTDFDGSSKVSNIISVENCTDENQSVINIFINNDNNISIQVKSSSYKKYDVSFYDALGKNIHRALLNVPEGTSINLLNPGNLSTGMYLITFQNEEEFFTNKLFVH